MKIVHLTPIYWDNWGYQENYIARYQAKFGHKVFVIAPATSLSPYRNDLNGQRTEYDIDGVHVIRLKLKINIINRFYWFDGLLGTLKQLNPGIIMIHGLAMVPILEILKYKKSNPNCLIYADFHSDYQNSGKNILSSIFLHKIIWRYFVNKAIPSIEKIYYTRPSVKKFIQDMYGIKDELLDELLFGSDLINYSLEARHDIRKKIRGGLNIPEDSFVICTGGKFDKAKNLKVLTDGISKLKKLEIHLIIFGSVESSFKNSFNELIKKIKNVHNLGWLNETEISECYISSDIAVFLGNHSVLWEKAICYGIPTIFSYQHDREYLDLNGNCLFVFGNIDIEVAQNIKMLVTNPQIISNMRKVAIENGATIFSYENIVGKLNESWGINAS